MTTSTELLSARQLPLLLALLVVVIWLILPSPGFTCIVAVALVLLTLSWSMWPAPSSLRSSGSRQQVAESRSRFESSRFLSASFGFLFLTALVLHWVLWVKLGLPPAPAMAGLGILIAGLIVTTITGRASPWLRIDPHFPVLLRSERGSFAVLAMFSALILLLAYLAVIALSQ